MLHDIMLDDDEDGELIEVLQEWMLPDEQLEQYFLEISLDEQLRLLQLIDMQLHDIMLDDDEDRELIEVLLDWEIPDEQLEP